LRADRQVHAAKADIFERACRNGASGSREAIEAKLHAPDAPVLTQDGAGQATGEAPASATARRFNGSLTFGA
jgi:hypothetical protein